MDIIGLMGAMEDEIAPLAACMVAKESTSLGGIRFTSGLLGGKKVVLCCAGMGKAQAAAATQLLCTHFGATAIVFSGIAGNMTDKIGVGDVCLGGTLVYHDGEPRMFAETYPHQQEFHSDARLLAAAASACEVAGVKHIVGKIATGDRFVGDKATKEAIAAKCAPDCVEMEGNKKGEKTGVSRRRQITNFVFFSVPVSPPILLPTDPPRTSLCPDGL